MKKKGSSDDEFYELSYYTLAHSDREYFIHQHIVDAYAAQTAGSESKVIKVIFALAGLYLYLEKGYTGREVQLVHMKMVKNKKNLPVVDLPDMRGNLTVSDVLAAEPGKERDEMIRRWCISVWDAFADSHEIIAGYLNKDLGI